MAKTSKDKLAEALEEIGDPALEPMIQQAREGYYSDYESPLPFPCVALVSDLMRAKQGRLAERAKMGEFDATKEEADAWAASEEGQATFREMLDTATGSENRRTSPRQ
jgi:hypothetical protein